MQIRKPEIQESLLETAESFAEDKPKKRSAKANPKKSAATKKATRTSKESTGNLPPEGYTRIIANVTVEQRRKLRVKAAMEDKSITDLISEWIDENC